MTDLLEPKKPVKPFFEMKLNKTQGVVELQQGSGGRATAQLIEQMFIKAFANPWLHQKNDAASFTVSGGRYVMSTDAHVISPLFFPGGNIGSLAVHGTINDLAMAGARPLYLTASFILEEGFPLADLEKIVCAMAEAANHAKVAIIAGDTKVVERGKGDGVFISTTGFGVIPEGVVISGDQAKPGDMVIISGFMGDHGVAILSQRNHLQFTTQVQSDTQALHELVQTMLAVSPSIHCLRDPTRGGVATSLNELATQSQVGIMINENCIPVRSEVASACELLGLDPLYIANEGKLLAICAPEDSERLIQAMCAHPLGSESAIIGQVVTDPLARVKIKTKLGGVRLIDWLLGDQLPRIC